MGLFSNKKKTEVTTTVLRVIKDNMVPDSGKRAVTQALFSGDDLATAYIEGMSGSIALKADRMFKWAKLNYYYKTPHSTLVSNITGKDVIRQILTASVGAPVTFEYFEYAPANSLHMGWEALVKHHGYDPSTNQLDNLSAAKGVPVYLKDMQAIYTEDTFEDADPGVLAQWGTPATAGYAPDRKAQIDSVLGDLRAQSNYIVDTTTLVDYIEVHYSYTQANGEQITERITLPMSGYSLESEYYHVKYSYTSPITKKKVTTYWSYEDGSGGNSAIDAIYLTKFDEIGNYFPNVYYKLGGENLAMDEERWYPPYLTSVKLCKYLGFDYAKLGKEINQQVADESYEQAYMTMGVPFNTENQVELLYLFRYFSLLYYNLPASSGMSGYSDFTPRSGQAIRIADKGFTTTLTHQGIARRRVAGTIGKVGHCTGGTRSIGHVEGYSTRTGKVFGLASKVINTPVRFFRLQVSEVFYEEVAVYGASFRYHVYGKYHVVATGESSKLLVPLDHSITSVIPSSKREELFSRSFHNVFNTVVVTETKWYASGAFKVIVMVIAVAIAFFSAGGLSGISLAIMTAMEMTVMALALAALEYVAMTMLIKFGAEFIVSKVGAKIGVLGAVLMVAAAAYFTGVADPGSATWAPQLLQVGNGLLDASNMAITEMAQGVNEMMKDFMLVVSENQKSLDDAQKLLGANINLNPYDFIGKAPMFVNGESPTDYFNRTVNSGNIGATSIEGQKYYIESMLRLPTISETTQGDLSYDGV